MAHFKDQPVLEELPEKFKSKLLAQLDTRMPLALTAPLVSDDSYWRRCAEATPGWAPCNIKEHDGSWKKLFFERTVQDLIEEFRPEQEDELMDGPGGLAEVLAIAAPYVTRLDINQLRPPDNSKPEEPGIIPAGEDDDTGEGGDGGDDDGGERDDTGASSAESNDHLDLTEVVRKLPNLKELRVAYCVRNCGMNFKWTMFGMTSVCIGHII